MKMLLNLEFIKQKKLIKIIVSIASIFTLFTLILINQIDTESITLSINIFLMSTNVILYPLLTLYIVLQSWNIEIDTSYMKFLYTSKFHFVKIVMAKVIYVTFHILPLVLSVNFLGVLFIIITGENSPIVIGHEIIGLGNLTSRIMIISILEMVYLFSIMILFQFLILWFNKISLSVIIMGIFYIFFIFVDVSEKLNFQEINFFRGNYIYTLITLNSLDFINAIIQLLIIYGMYNSFILLTTTHVITTKDIH